MVRSTRYYDGKLIISPQLLTGRITMRSENRRYVQALVQLQRSTFEIVALAIVLAFGINLLSSGLPTVLSFSSESTAILGAALTALSFIYVAVRGGPTLSRRLTLDGIMPVSNEGEVETVSRYEFSENMRSYFVAITSENKAIGTAWKKAQFGSFDADETEARQKTKEFGNQLVREAIEYFALSQLSLHLSEYFQSERRIDDETVIRVQRRDIPQLLLDNRFLELFSKPMNEREAFMDHDDDEHEHGGRIVWATGENGQLFDLFELILPKGSKVSRMGKNGLRIDTSRFGLLLQAEFDRSSTNFPSEFEELYLGRKFTEVHPFLVRLRVQVDFKWWSIVTRTGWDYYEWLDSFLEKLENHFSFDHFIESSGWPTAHTTAIAWRNIKSGT